MVFAAVSALGYLPAGLAVSCVMVSHAFSASRGSPIYPLRISPLLTVIVLLEPEPLGVEVGSVPPPVDRDPVKYYYLLGFLRFKV